MIEWMRWSHGADEPRMRVLCLPYAGGNGMIFRSWSRILEGVQICAPALPGRGRLREIEPPTDIDSLIGSLVDSVMPLLDRPFVVFGHSMGAAVGHALVTRLALNGAPAPERFFASAARPPHLPRVGTPLYRRSDAALLDAVNDPRDAATIETPTLKRKLSVLRADLAVYDSYRPDPGDRLACPLTAFGGLDDPMISRDELTRWRDLTSASFVRRMMPGDHFYFVKHQPPLLRALKRELDSIVPC